MEAEQIRQLLDRYWAAETSLAEEQALAEAMAADQLPEDLADLAHDKAWFTYRESQRGTQLPTDFEQRFWQEVETPEQATPKRQIAFLQWGSRIAAALVLAVGAFALLNNQNNQHTGDVLAYDQSGEEAEALAHATAALMMLSEKLQFGQTEAARLGALNTAMEDYIPRETLRNAMSPISR
jgi:hypothetical protein